MKDLSVIIVNYNVEYFLEQCLRSVAEAKGDLDMEVIVVDNASVDGSLDMIRTRFPEVRLIANTDNRGFSKANNQGIEASQGRYVLLLNPDTVVEEDTFLRCVEYMDAHPDVGGLGVKMLDGSGRFLPESKRALPTPEVAFYKVSGLSNLFPRHRRFARYHLGHLSAEEDHEIEVLSGAYMFMRRSALDKVGLLDEEFFMYGEDIDLSYRITQGGYKNVYLSSARIIHYKGESTKKGSLNYVKVFYNAMRIFARKHFSQRQAKWYNLFIEAAIYARAGLSLLKGAVLKVWHPLLDFGAIWAGLYLATQLYTQQTGIRIPSELSQWVFPLYSAIWVGAGIWSSAYDTPYKARHVVLSSLYGTLTILILYALLPEEWRFSRLLTFSGAFISLLVMGLSRGLVHALSPRSRRAEGTERRFLLVGHAEERTRIRSLMLDLAILPERIHETEASENTEQSIELVKEQVQVLNIQEVVFSAKDMRAQAIIEHMSALDAEKVEFKIAPPESLFIIGSNDKNDNGDLLGFQMNAIGKKVNQRNKRSLDVLLSLLLLIFSPLLLWFQLRPLGFLGNVVKVLFGQRSWVGYNPARVHRLPPLRPGILYPGFALDMDPEQAQRSNLIYAKDYSVNKDMDLLSQHWRALGRAL